MCSGLDSDCRANPKPISTDGLLVMPGTVLADVPIGAALTSAIGIAMWVLAYLELALSPCLNGKLNMLVGLAALLDTSGKQDGLIRKGLGSPGELEAEAGTLSVLPF